jgi:hypothetical protein
MQTMTQRPNRRPKLYLPLFLSEPKAPAPRRKEASFPLSPDQLRRTIAETIG